MLESSVYPTTADASALVHLKQATNDLLHFGGVLR